MKSFTRYLLSEKLYYLKEQDKLSQPKGSNKKKVTFFLIFLILLLVNSFSFAQVNIQGTAPVETPKGGFAVDGDAFEGQPPLYSLVGDWFIFSEGANPNGIFPSIIDFNNVDENGSLIVGDWPYPNTFFFRDEIGNKDPTIFTSSNKIDDNPKTYEWGLQSAPNKNEIQNAMVHFTFGDDGLSPPGDPNDLWVLFAADREVTNGSSYIDFEFLQEPLSRTGLQAGSGGFTTEAPDATGGRTVGDILITIEFTNGGGAANVVIRRWESSGGMYQYVLYTPAPSLLYSTNNTQTIEVPYPLYNQSEVSPGKWEYSINQWAEGAANLTQIFSALDPCFNISTLFVRTRTSGSSGQSELKDFPGGPVQLELNLNPEAGLTSSPVCDGEDVTFTATPSGADDYTFFFDADDDGILDAGEEIYKQGAEDFLTDTFSHGDVVSVQVTTNGVCIDVASDSATVDALPVVTANDTSVCIGSTVQLTASPIGGTWSGDYISASGEFDADGLAADDYIVTYTYNDDNGCENSDTATVTVDALPNVVADDDSVCIGSTVQLSASPSGGTWSGDYVSASGLFDADGLAADDYVVTYTYSDGNGCENSDTATVTVDALPNVVADDDSVCIGSTVQLSASPSGGTWSGDYVSASGLFDADGLAADDYIVTYTYSDGNGCENSDTATVTVDALPVVTANDTSVCIGSTVQLTASPIGGTWSGDYISASGEFDADGLAADDYIVTYTYNDDNGCENSDTATVTVDALPNVVADDDSVCIGSTVQLSASPSGGTWSGDYVSASGLFDADGLAADDYIVTYTYSDGNGCENSDTATVTVDALPNVVADDDSVCIGSTVQLSASPSGGTWSGDYVSASGLFDADGLAADDYIVTYTYSDGNGCENSDTATVTVDALPNVVADDDSVCIGSTVQLSASPSGGTWSGDYVSASGLFDADGLAADDYVVTYTYNDGNGCENSDTATVTVFPLPDTPDYQPSQADCLGGDGGLVFLNVGDNMYYSIEGGDFVLYDGEISLAEGFYDFRIRYDEDGCISDEFEVEIQRPDDDIVTLVPDVIQPDCDTFQGTIVITNAGDLGDLNYTVTNEDTNTDYYTSVAYPVGGFTGLPAGNYYVSAISDNGCITGNIRVPLNEPMCDDFTGCTLGYWKNHTNRWCDAYQTCTSYVEAFFNYAGGYDDAPAELRDLTLQEVLNLGGGGVYNFGRQSVAALLNACSGEVDYELPAVTDVIGYVRDNVNNARAAGSYLDMLNNAGCTMGGSRATTAPSDGCDDEANSGNGKPGKNGKNGKGKGGNEKIVSSSVSAYPVPFKETVNIQYDIEYSSDVVIEIYDMRGKHLRTYTDKNVSKGKVTSLNVDFALKANQMYVVKIKTDRETIVKQIVSSKK